MQAPASRAVSLAIECRKIPSRKMCKPTAPISSPSSETPTVPGAKYLMKAFVLELRIYQHRPDRKHGHTRRTDNLGTETLPGHMGHTQQPSTFSAAKAPGEADSGDSRPATPPDGDQDYGHNKEVNLDHSGFGTDDTVDSKAQAGVQNIQAMASLWTQPAIITTYISIWVIYLIDSMQQSNSGALKPYVTSAFQSHSLTPTVDIFSSIIGGVFKLTLAKVLNVFGRPQGYLLSIIFLTMGLVMMAGCNGVKTHAAAQIFYWVGSVLPLYIHTRYNGVDFSLHIFIADTPALKNQGLIIAYAVSPYIITTWITGYMTTAFLKGPGFR
ncbi:Siderophore transporter [Fusarium falciforme]|uniref:Siderophore transporter n=1 Tax=Fusarium falciforme TaxID=195108 RepID=UPI0023001AF1|nr:Siderophore transporter [Fusarium falciforme]WAO93066.1 Siderophore transporter [Fusarium falciforme]